MRLFLAAAAFSALALPAAAQTQSERKVVDALNNPIVQEGVATVLDSLAGIVLDTRVGMLSRYSNGEIRSDDTLRSVERRRDPEFEARMRAQTRRAVATAGAMAGDAVELGASVRDTGEKLRAAIAPLAELAAGLAASYDN